MCPKSVYQCQKQPVSIPVYLPLHKYFTVVFQRFCSGISGTFLWQFLKYFVVNFLYFSSSNIICYIWPIVEHQKYLTGHQNMKIVKPKCENEKSNKKIKAKQLLKKNEPKDIKIDTMAVM